MTMNLSFLHYYVLTFKYAMLICFISVGMIILGAVVAGARDLSFDTYSYSVVFIANICTAIYLASIARIGNDYFPFFCRFNMWKWGFEHLGLI